MDLYVQIRADIPVELKRRTFAVLALRGLPFNRWLQERMEEWLDEVRVESAERLGGKGWCSGVDREDGHGVLSAR
jgi:hypothetical protein